MSTPTDVQIAQDAADPAAVLTVLASGQWPGGPDDELPAVAGFVVSEFSPLAAALADLCLLGYFGSPPADPGRGERTAIVLASSTGDVGTAAAVARAVQDGRRVPPLLFYQSNPNAVAGYIAARWGLAGPVVCTMPTGDPLTDALASASLLITDGDADAALVVVADAGLAGPAEGTALLVGPVSWPSARAGGTESTRLGTWTPSPGERSL
ncbi:MAG TPA: beta-ketoacyl synthase chain length factor [Streptosporangiaceae bacterium]|nr:beta-ketoacyl synthase chain length factor [Streptosporangiaceae bacterium]